jgi:hypothetical protein
MGPVKGWPSSAECPLQMKEALNQLMFLVMKDAYKSGWYKQYYLLLTGG